MSILRLTGPRSLSTALLTLLTFSSLQVTVDAARIIFSHERATRPQRIAVIVRGIPGSGKARRACPLGALTRAFPVSCVVPDSLSPAATILSSPQSRIAKALRDAEVSAGGEARILSLDDYFMTEVEKEVAEDPAGGGRARRCAPLRSDLAPAPRRRPRSTSPLAP